MARTIRNRSFVGDGWRLLEAGAFLVPGEDGFVPEFPAGDVVVPLSLWRLRGEELIARPGRVGVLLEANDEPEAIAAQLGHFALVAVRFEKFSDGRGHSLARLLRERHGWRGELRAVGDVRRDLLPFLERAGFDAYEMRDEEDAGAVLSVFDEIRVQLPAFRRSATQTA